MDTVGSAFPADLGKKSDGQVWDLVKKASGHQMSVKRWMQVDFSCSDPQGRNKLELDIRIARARC